MSKVSVIVPVYNTEAYIYDCLDSLIKQSYKNLEIIVINDYSTDSSKKKIEQIAQKDERIKTFHFTKRKGVGAARNFGIKKATGDYIYFLDSDDYLPENTLQLLISHIGNSEIIRGAIKTTYLSSSFAVVFEGLYNPRVYKENRFNLINNKTALNCLISKQLIEKNELTFSENIKIYSDLYFMVPALLAVNHVKFLKEAIYFKRRRNDPITNPSLCQYDDKVKINNFLKVYNVLKDKYDSNLVNEFLDELLLNFYRKDIIRFYKDKSTIEATFDTLSEATQRLDSKLVSKYDMILKREIKALHSGKMKKYKNVNSTHRFLREFRKGLKSKRKFYIFLYRHLFMKLPMRKKLIFFESFLGKNYSDSPKYIYEQLLKENLNYKFVWSFNQETEIPGNATKVKRFSLKYFYYLARAKYWVSNSRLPKYLDKREGNIYLQTWHGTPLKKLVFDMEEIYSADPKYKENFYHQSRRWDYLSSPNAYSSKIFKRAFKFEKTMLEFGYPRNDILYNRNNKEDIDQLKKAMRIPNDKKVILYAPTWRDDDYFARGKYNFELQLNLRKLKEKLGNNYIILLRMHYFIANQIDITSYKGFAYDFSNYDDIAELYLVSDILITDYSSVFFDYANLQRPILFYTYDLEKYRDQLRGFYLDIEKELPGPLLMQTKEVIDAILNIDQVKDEFKERYKVFYNKFCKWDDGKASKKTVAEVFKE